MFTVCTMFTVITTMFAMLVHDLHDVSLFHRVQHVHCYRLHVHHLMNIPTLGMYFILWTRCFGPWKPHSVMGTTRSAKQYTVRPKKFSDLILTAQEIEFESCK